MMSRAFTREDDADAAFAGITERPVSQNRNLVTANGLALMDAEIASLRARHAAATTDQIPAILRDLRYWVSRRETAELSVPDRDSEVIRFGMRVSIEDEKGKSQSWAIVGEDEADANMGLISHVSPMARALFGKTVGDLVTVNGHEWEVIDIETI